MKAAVARQLEYVRAEFLRLGSKRSAEERKRFFKPDERWDGYGVPAPLVQEVARKVYHEVKKWPPADRDALAVSLWKGGNVEEGGLVCYVYRRFAKQFGAPDFEKFSIWIDRYVRNWAHCDGVSAWLVVAAVANEPELIARLKKWTGSRNRWKRRAAAVSMVPLVRAGRDTAEALDIAERLVRDDDDMVRKGVGWMLKDAYPKASTAVVRFLMPRRLEVPRLVLRLSAEKMTPADKARILKKSED